MTARSPGVPSSDKRTTVSFPDPATKSCLPSGEAATPLSAEIVAASGTSSHPVFGRQISMPPSGCPAISLSAAFGSLVLMKLLAAKASPGRRRSPDDLSAIFRRRTPRDGQHGRLERATGRACPMHCERKHAFRGLGRKERDPYCRPASIRLTAPHRADYGNGGASASLGSINVRLALLTVTRSKRWPTRSKPWCHHIFSVPLDRRTQFSSTSRVTAARCESTRLVQQGEGE